MHVDEFGWLPLVIVLVLNPWRSFWRYWSLNVLFYLFLHLAFVKHRFLNSRSRPTQFLLLEFGWLLRLLHSLLNSDWRAIVMEGRLVPLFWLINRLKKNFRRPGSIKCIELANHVLSGLLLGLAYFWKDQLALCILAISWLYDVLGTCWNAKGALLWFLVFFEVGLINFHVDSWLRSSSRRLLFVIANSSISVFLFVKRPLLQIEEWLKLFAHFW